jgi:hypothetical protein
MRGGAFVDCVSDGEPRGSLRSSGSGEEPVKATLGLVRINAAAEAVGFTARLKPHPFKAASLFFPAMYLLVHVFDFKSDLCGLGEHGGDGAIFFFRQADCIFDCLARNFPADAVG